MILRIFLDASRGRSDEPIDIEYAHGTFLRAIKMLSSAEQEALAEQAAREVREAILSAGSFITAVEFFKASER